MLWVSGLGDWICWSSNAWLIRCWGRRLRGGMGCSWRRGLRRGECGGNGNWQKTRLWGRWRDGWDEKDCDLYMNWDGCILRNWKGILGYGKLHYSNMVWKVLRRAERVVDSIKSSSLWSHMLNKLILPTDALYSALALGRTCGHQFEVRAERWGVWVWGRVGENIIVSWETYILIVNRILSLAVQICMLRKLFRNIFEMPIGMK